MQTIVFDFGNVVGFFDHGRTLRKLERFTDMTAQEMYANIYSGALETDFETGQIGEDEFLRRFISGCRLKCNRDFLAEACADIFWANPEVCDLIPRLKSRYQLLLGSNTNAIHARFFQTQFAEIFRNFDALVLSHEIGVRKPHVGFFEHCQRLARGKPEECVFIDDIAENVAGARTLGWKGIVYQPNDGLVEKLRAADVRV